MNQKRLLKLLSKKGWYLYRHGNNHDIWTNGIEKEQIPRHREINELLAKSIIKKHHLDDEED